MIGCLAAAAILVVVYIVVRVTFYCLDCGARLYKPGFCDRCKP